MDFANLQAFIAVAEQHSFSRAAGQLFLTQPAVSKRIAALEDELASALFDRIGHQVQLTEAGQALLPRARQILLELEDSRRAIRNLSGQVGGQLSMVTSHHIGLHRLPNVLRRYARDYSQVELDLQFMESEQACQAVLHGDSELGVVTLPLSPPTELKFQSVWRDPLYLVVGPGHTLAHTPLTAQRLMAWPAILPMRGTFTRSLVEQAFAKLNSATPLQVKLATNNLETIKMMVSIGLGWSVLPQTLLQDSELIPLELPGLSLQRQLGVVWHTGRTLSNAAVAMRTYLQETVSPAG
ncbi:MAG: LysR family transcriptional regulator [Thiohalophilus sp.]|jgi:DNA-binding transcriptional LysR family regulator